MLPFIEQNNLFTTYKSTITGVSQTDGFNNHTATDPIMVAARQSQISTFFCPSRRGAPSLSIITSGSTVTGMPSDYAASSGNTSTAPTNGVFRIVNSNHMKEMTKMSEITDGTTNTFMIGEKHIQLGKINDYIQDGMILSGSEQQTYHRRGGASWPLANTNAAAINTQFGSWHTGVCLFVFADGSVQALSNSLPGTMLGTWLRATTETLSRSNSPACSVCCASHVRTAVHFHYPWSVGPCCTPNTDSYAEAYAGWD